MARATKRLVINTYASEAGRQGSNFSLDDPLASSRQDLLAGRLRFTPGGVNEPDLASQLQMQGLNNMGLGGSPLTVNPSVSDQPNVTPFPLGCPPNFYQSGNVCIPVVGTYPDGTTYAPAAGHEYPKAVIQQSVAPTVTTKGDQFYIQVFFKNTGSFRGKFFLRAKIPSISIDLESQGVWIPQDSTGLIYIKILMPGNAPSCTTTMACAVEVSHLDENASSSTIGQHLVDDSDNINIPCPGGAGTSCTPPSGGCPANTTWDATQCACVNNPSGDPTQCFTMTLPQLTQYAQQYPGAFMINNANAIVAMLLQQGLNVNTTALTFCQSASQAFNPGCVKSVTSGGTKVYCITSTAGGNTNTTAVILLNPSTSVPDGHSIVIQGSGYQPNEAIVITLVLVTHSLQSSTHNYEGHTTTVTVNTHANNQGAFTTTINAPSFPAGVNGIATITARGVTSQKTASKSLSVT